MPLKKLLLDGRGRGNHIAELAADANERLNPGNDPDAREFLRVWVGARANRYASSWIFAKARLRGHRRGAGSLR